MTVTYGVGRRIALDFERAIKVVTKMLRVKGFGVLTDIDVQAILKMKIGEDIPPYQNSGCL